MAGLMKCSGSDMLSEVLKMDEKYEYMVTCPDRVDKTSIEEMNTLGHNEWENYAAFLNEEGKPVLLWKRVFKFREAGQIEECD